MLPETERHLAETTLRRYCENKVPARIQHKLKMAFKIRGNSATLFEQRPVLNDPSRWIDIAVAQFRFDPKSKKWELYCRDRNERWWYYEEADPAKSIQTLLDEVDADPTGIFWG